MTLGRRLVRQEVEVREKIELRAKKLGFSIAERAELEEPKCKWAPSTNLKRYFEIPTLTWSDRGRNPG